MKTSQGKKKETEQNNALDEGPYIIAKLNRQKEREREKKIIIIKK